MFTVTLPVSMFYLTSKILNMVTHVINLTVEIYLTPWRWAFAFNADLQNALFSKEASPALRDSLL